jgi:hypothetical protein
MQSRSQAVCYMHTVGKSQKQQHNLPSEMCSAWQRGTLRLPCLSASRHTMPQLGVSAFNITAVIVAASSAITVHVRSAGLRSVRVGSPGGGVGMGR